MYKVCKQGMVRKGWDKGSATLEMCFVIPIIMWICVNIIFVFLDLIGDGIVQGNSYTAIYTYTNNRREVVEQGLYDRSVYVGDGYLMSNGAIATSDTDGYTYEGRSSIYKTEYNLHTERLRRWQLYGDALRE